MEQGYYSKDHAGYYREGFLAHGSMSSKVFYTTWHWGPLAAGSASAPFQCAGLSRYDGPVLSLGGNEKARVHHVFRRRDGRNSYEGSRCSH